MSTIRHAQQEIYDSIWQLPAYATNSPGEQHVSTFLDMAQPHMRGSVLDAGCGAGKGALALCAAGFAVTMVDLTPEGLLPATQAFPFYRAPLWSDLKRIVGFQDWVYCCDVMEHIPTEFTMLVVQQMLRVARKGVFFSIALQPDVYGAWIGESLHQTVRPFTWWRDNLRELGRLVECRDALDTGFYLLQPEVIA